MDKIKESKIDHIVSSIKDIQYGSIVITIHDGEITQVDITEKKRFPVLKRNNLKA